MTAASSVLDQGPPTRPSRLQPILGDHHLATGAVMAALVGTTLLVVDPLANALAYAVVQAVLVAVAAVDIAERRIPNVAVAALGAFVVVCRAVSDPRGLAEAAIIAFVVLLVAGALSVWSKGGLGMGDAKLAAVLGLVLGSGVSAALVLGTIFGAVPGLVALGRRGLGARHETLAYGPYLVLGAVVTILLLDPPSLL